MKKILFTSLLLIAAVLGTTVSAQDKVVDQIVAIVGGNIIFKSEIERMHIEQQAQGITTDGDMKCEILENYLIDKLLVAEAELDTLIEVTPSQVNQRMDQQLAMYVSYMGSEKAVEEYFKKSIVEIKAEMKEGIRNSVFKSANERKNCSGCNGNTFRSALQLQKFKRRRNSYHSYTIRICTNNISTKNQH